MSYRLRVSRHAGRQIRDASTWWLRNRDKAPFAFADDLDDALHLVADVPGVGQPVPHARIHSLRRLLLARTQHHLYYSVDDTTESVEILSLWHASRGKDPQL